MNRLDDWANESQVAVFRLGAEEYGIDIAGVQEIMRVPAITRIPQAAASVEGVFNFRGRVIPVVDLRQRFGLQSGELTRQSRVVVTEVGAATLGLMVDDVSEVLRIVGERIEPPPGLTQGRLDANFVRGIAKLEDRLVILLDLERILTHNEVEIVPAMSVQVT